MSDYTPSLDVLAAHYCNDRSADNYEERMAYEAKRRVEFDRAIAKVRADAKAEALREAADEVGAWGPACIPAAQALRARADKLDTL